MKYKFSCSHNILCIKATLLYPLLADLSCLSVKKGIPYEDDSMWRPDRDYPIVHRYTYDLEDEELMILKLKYPEEVFRSFLRPVDTVDTEICP